MKIALLNIATGPYITLFEQLKSSVKKNFLTSHDVEIFLFTDSDEHFYDEKIVIKKNEVKNERL